MTAMDPEGRDGLLERSVNRPFIVAIDRPQRLQKVNLEIEEAEISRTQELSLAVSDDGGQT